MSDSHVSQLIEKQMRNWELARAQKLEDLPEEARPEVQDFVCVSRMVGVDGRAVAAELGKKLGWPVFDRELLDEMAGDSFNRKAIYSSMDERDLTWSEEIMRGFFETTFVKNDYFQRLCETVLLLARKGHTVFLGRGVDLVLPRRLGTRVRLTAPWKVRVASLAAQRGVDEAAAQAEIARVEEERTRFFERHFRVATEDPARYDLTLNMQSFTAAQAAELILKARELRA